MSEDEQKAKVDHETPEGASTKKQWNDLGYTATAKWMVLRKDDKPSAEVFHISYVADTDDPKRPVTFVFNGGPGAASAYLHMAALAPDRIDFPEDGTMPTLPIRLVQNDESWIAFTDIVFIDPVGTGFSRIIEPEAPKDGDAKKNDHDPKHYYTIRKDLEAMCEVVYRWLSENGRWGAPVFLAGESYGGYRTGRLVKMLQEQTGVGLNGAILISPALEPAHLAMVFGWGDYEIEPWLDMLPGFAATAVHHGRSRVYDKGTPVEQFLPEVEKFAIGDYASFLASGAAMPAEKREQVLTHLADLTGLDVGLVTRAEGRVKLETFVRSLLQDEGKVVGRYDGTITTIDPFPDRDMYHGADPTLTAVGHAFTTGVNRQLRQEIGVKTDREYKLLSTEITLAWKNDESLHYIHGTQGAVDDFRYGMAMNPHMKAFITHGLYDLITPYYASDRFRNLMRLDASVADRVTVKHFDGGHMFYTWTESRKGFAAAIKAFMADAIGAA